MDAWEINSESVVQCVLLSYIYMDANLVTILFVNRKGNNVMLHSFTSSLFCS